jgi:hypothetical protein
MKRWRNVLVFALGLASALLLGWGAFPRVLYTQKHQPLDFLHKTHAEKSGLSDCSECHSMREDGSFAGLPATEKCAGCHSERLSDSKAEAILVDNYIKRGQETPWLVYARQPENVWFSHSHSCEARQSDLQRVSFQVRRVGQPACIRGEPDQRLQPRHLGTLDITPAKSSA